MKEAFKAVKVTDRVYWVGAIDWAVRDFHGYLTSRGTTYNAFLILADKVTLIDTVKAPFKDEMLARIESIIDPGKIDYIISNHAELDHSGALLETINVTSPEKIFASKMGVAALKAHFHDRIDVTAVADGESLSLGNATITFAETKMCHWPDSMVSYLHEDELLFSQDAFGMHLATQERFADEIDPAVLDQEASKYYANILLHLSPFIKKTLAKIGELGLKISMIATDHGPIWRRQEDIARIIESYARWADQAPTRKVVVAYDTMWKSTALMARAISEGLVEGGATVKLMTMGRDHRSDLAAELLDAGALVVGSPTLNNNLFPTLADALTYLKGLRPANLIGAAFGSFGWSGEAAKVIQASLEEMQMDMPLEPLRIKYVPDGEALKQCRQFGRSIAERLIKKLAGAN